MHPALESYVVEETTYSNGEVIIEEGSQGSWVYVILEGIAKVKKELRREWLRSTFFERVRFLGR